MKRSMNSIVKASVRFLMMALLCCMFAVPASAKPSNVKVLRAYAKYVSTQWRNGTKARYAVIDIDGNGVKELIMFRGASGSSGARVDFYMYHNGKVVKLSMDKCVTGCSTVFRIRGTKNFCVCKNGSGGSRFYYIYKKSGSRMKMVGSFAKQYNGTTRKYFYKLNGKKVSYSKFRAYYLKLTALKLIG